MLTEMAFPSDRMRFKDKIIANNAKAIKGVSSCVGLSDELRLSYQSSHVTPIQTAALLIVDPMKKESAQSQTCPQFEDLSWN